MGTGKIKPNSEKIICKITNCGGEMGFNGIQKKEK